MLKLDTPTRFLALQWDEEDWEFDRPVVLLEPVVKFAFTDCENVIEDAIIEACLALETGDAFIDEWDQASLREEFAGRGYDLAQLRIIAAALLADPGAKVGQEKSYLALEKTFTFVSEDGEVEAVEA